MCELTKAQAEALALLELEALEEQLAVIQAQPDYDAEAEPSEVYY